MITEISYAELGVNRGATLPSPLVYNGAMHVLVDFDDDYGVARYDDGQASVVVLENPVADPDSDE